MVNGATSTELNDSLELTLCHLIRKTPYYPKYGLHEKAKCLTRVKVDETLACLRDNDNEASNFIRNK